MKPVNGKTVFATSYTLDGCIYGSYVWATDAQHAKFIVQQRGVGELVSGAGWKDDTWFRLRRLPRTVEDAELQRIHYLTFLSFVALKSGLFTIDSIMGDRGWFHEYIHRLHLKGEPLNRSAKEIDQNIYEVEQQLGFTP